MSQTIYMPTRSKHKWYGLKSSRFSYNKKRQFKVKDHIWKLARISILNSGKKHFKERHEVTSTFKFGKRVYRDRGLTTDVTKLALTKSGKTKIEYIP